MSPIPNEIPDFGSAQVAPRQNPAFSPGAGFTTEDYFVWSRLDGTTSLREVILMVGLGPQKAIEILRKLRQLGAVLLPGETPETVQRPEPPAPPVDLGPLSPDEEGALAEAVQLTENEKRSIIRMMRVVTGGTYFEVLGVSETANRRELKRAYFRLSKEFHPDRYYEHELGSFGRRLSRIFETATQAFQVLSDRDQRAAYLATLGQGRSHRAALRAATEGGAAAGRAQTPSEQAAELFSRGCDREVAGDRDDALKLFAAAIRADPHPRYLRRAASCALGAGELSQAEEYAKKAAGLRPDDPSYARLLADVYRAAGKLDQAERILVNALRISTASDILARELEADLAAVRAAREEV